MRPAIARARFARHHCGLPHARMPPQHRLNFTGLDTKAANLDLVVAAAEKFERTVLTHPDEVAGAIESRLRSSIGAEEETKRSAVSAGRFQ